MGARSRGPAGYSGTPLLEKLGIKDGHTVGVVDGPPELAELLGELPPAVVLRDEIGDGPDVVMLFVTEATELAKSLPAARKAIFPAGAIWVAWPKRASEVPTDVTEDTVRELALPMGLVDNKVCAISEVWSGLRLVWRKELRSRGASPPATG